MISGRRQAIFAASGTSLGRAEEPSGAGPQRGFGSRGWLNHGGRFAACKRKELIREGFGRGHAELRLLGEARADDVVEGCGDGRIGVGSRQRSGREDTVANGGD